MQGIICRQVKTIVVFVRDFEGCSRFQALKAANGALLSPMRSLNLRGHGREDVMRSPGDCSGSQIIGCIDLEKTL